MRPTRRPWAVAAQCMARRNVHLFTPASRFQLLAREVIFRLAARPSLAPVMRRPLKRQGERLQTPPQHHQAIPRMANPHHGRAEGG